MRAPPARRFCARALVHLRQHAARALLAMAAFRRRERRWWRGYDGLARRHARVVGVTLTGTLGVLVRAKTAGHITRVAPLVSKLMELGFRLSEQTRDEVLKLANEV